MVPSLVGKGRPANCNMVESELTLNSVQGRQVTEKKGTTGYMRVRVWGREECPRRVKIGKRAFSRHVHFNQRAQHE
jgi:hypothetical protein